MVPSSHIGDRATIAVLGPLPLACSVRDCGLPLTRRDRAWVCPRGHSYDIARSGYLNLLQPQDRRSRTAGDAKEAVEARARLLTAGVGRSVVEAIVRTVSSLVLPENAVVVDLGSGGGDVLAAVASARPIHGIGIDLSTAAAEDAARRHTSLTWVVANADRRLPLLDASASVVLSLHGRRNPVECARVLPASGVLIVAVPAHDDLVQLREIVQGRRVERDRADQLVAEHDPHFAPVERFSVREQHRLEREALLDLLRGTYRGERTSAAARVSTLDRLEITLASEVFLFKVRSTKSEVQNRLHF